MAFKLIHFEKLGVYGKTIGEWRSSRFVWLAGLELLLIVVGAPLLIFPRSFLPLLGLALLVAGWLARTVRTGQWIVRTPLDRPIAIIFLATIVSLYPSVDWSLSLPKFYGIILGLFVYYASASYVSEELKPSSPERSSRRFWIGVRLLLVATVVVSVLGLVGTQWITGKLAPLQGVYAVLPRVIKNVPNSFGAAAGFHPNELGGTLAFLLPLPLALLLQHRLPLLLRVALGFTLLLGASVLLLSVSRSAIVGTAIAVVSLIIWRWRRAGLALAASVLVAAAVIFAVDANAAWSFLLRVDFVGDAPGAGSLPSRMEIWDRAIYMIEDFPFTGIGLNTFPVILDALYPTFISDSTMPIPHAHNIYLHTAVDLGAGGFLGFLGLWVCAGCAGWRAYRQIGNCSYYPRAMRTAIVGMMSGLLAYLVYGLTDAITLGAKPLVLVWFMLGLIAGACRSAAVVADPSPGRGLTAITRLVSAFLWDAYWVLAFLLVGLGYLVVALGVSGWIL